MNTYHASRRNLSRCVYIKSKLSYLLTVTSSIINAIKKTRKNILISSGTSRGKTTFVNALSMLIPENERVITIEDSAELKFNQVTLSSRRTL